MQVIPANWQSTIEDHVATMHTAMDYAMQVGPGDEHSRRWELYKGTCEAFMEDIRAHFTSPAGFDDFLKSRTREAYRICGHEDIPEGYWNDYKELSGMPLDAQNLAAQYVHGYKSQIDTLARDFKRKREKEVLNEIPEAPFLHHG